MAPTSAVRGLFYLTIVYFHFSRIPNQSRMCGKGVGNGSEYLKTNYVLYCHLVILGLIYAMFLTSQSYDFDVIAHAGAGVE